MDIADPRDKMPAPVAEPLETDVTQPQGDPSLAADLRRRRLLRGLAALPAVYTLGSGAQTAVLSSHQCVNHTDLTDPATAGLLHTPAGATGGICAGGYQRGVPAWDGLQLTNQGQTYLLFNYDSANATGDFYDLSGIRWVATQPNSQQTDFTQDGTNLSIRVRTNQIPTLRVAVRPAVYVNDQGGVAFYPDKAQLTGATPISCSCWSSFAPQDANPFA
jgi:hypothetical protein